MKIQEFDHYFLANGLKCHWNFWLLPKSFRAITLFGHIFFNISKDELKEYLNKKSAIRTMRHEKIHVVQAESFKTKYLEFYIYYLYYWIKNLFKYGVKDHIAYRNIPFEREAFDRENTDVFESKWRDYIEEGE
jgi:hypothetical protein